VEEAMKEQVEKALDLIRPALQNDGGDIELIDVDEATGVVKVKLVGACGSCPMSQMTLRMGVERVLKEEVPEVTKPVALFSSSLRRRRSSVVADKR
jgi:Fe-S cluster biogenesis protein NfuA